MDIIEKNAFLYFWNEANPETGLVKDRAGNFKADNYFIASIAACGFGLAAIPIGIERGWISREEGYQRALKSLEFFYLKSENIGGFYYHFVDMNTGKRVVKSEISSIDTGLLLGGVITVGEYFKNTEVEELAKKIYEQVDWHFMLNGGDTLSHGLVPGRGFLDARWSSYCESMILYILGIGSPTHPLPASSWDAWSRPTYNYNGYRYIHCPFIFTYQYSHLFFDFKNKHDKYADYFINSIIATKAHKEFCNNIFNGYHEDLWGVTPSDGLGGYKSWGGPPTCDISLDGTIVPSASAGSLIFTPLESMGALRHIYDNYKDKIWGRYGFADSFNPRTGWVASDCIGIDQGALLLSIENMRSGLIWKYFMRNEYVRQAETMIGFEPGQKAGDVVSLSGVVKFRTGDDPGWAAKDMGKNTPKDKPSQEPYWADIEIPGFWEGQGFRDYDGIAWYRISFTVPAQSAEAWERSWIILKIGAIDDIDQTYFNGELIGEMGDFTKEYSTEAEKERAYSVPQRLIQYSGENTIAIRVRDNARGGGIFREPIEIGPYEQIDYKQFKLHVQEKVIKDLSGYWAFKTGDDAELSGRLYADDSWDKIKVPNSWESQGFKDYDGYAWYRLHFNMPKAWSIRPKELYFGGIDDVDEVYLNGKKIGQTGRFPQDFETAWYKERCYDLPEDMIQYGSDNVIAVRVYDYIKEGGVRKGPVEIRMQPEK